MRRLFIEVTQDKGKTWNFYAEVEGVFEVPGILYAQIKFLIPGQYRFTPIPDVIDGECWPTKKEDTNEYPLRLSGGTNVRYDGPGSERLENASEEVPG